jgi:hypothetical protein
MNRPDKPPRPQESDSIAAAFQQLFKSGSSLSAPTDAEPEVPAVVGEQMPTTLVTGKNRSSLLGSLAIAVGAIREDITAENLFYDLSRCYRDFTSRMDSPKRIQENLRKIRNFKLDALKEIVLSPLIPPLSQDSDIAITRTIEVLGSGSAVILPYKFKQDGRRTIPTGRTYWGAITGYWEEIQELPIPKASHVSAIGDEKLSKLVTVNFTMGLALKDEPMRPVLPEDELAGQLGDGQTAVLVSSLR